MSVLSFGGLNWNLEWQLLERTSMWVHIHLTFFLKAIAHARIFQNNFHSFFESEGAIRLEALDLERPCIPRNYDKSRVAWC